MRRDLELLYEKTLIEEEIGSLNYWLSPTGDLIKVDEHIGYAIKNFNLPIDDNSEEDEVYDTAFKMGYNRIVEQPATIYVTYGRAKPPNKKQFEILYGMAMDKNKNLVDGETNKVIVKNNEIEPDVARNAKLDQMERELQPSFYKKRRDYGESFAKYDLSDYTKLIY